VRPPAGDEAIGRRAAEIFAGWQRAVSAAFTRSGVPADRSASLATTLLAALDGAVSLSRATRSLGPLNDVETSLSRLTGD
jgi:hypothetical protein